MRAFLIEVPSFLLIIFLPKKCNIFVFLRLISRKENKKQ